MAAGPPSGGLSLNYILRFFAGSWQSPFLR